MYLYVFVNTYMCMYVRQLLYIYVYVCMYVYVSVNMCAYECRYVCVCMYYMYERVFLDLSIRMHM